MSMPNAAAPSASRLFAITGMPTKNGPANRKLIAAISRNIMNIFGVFHTKRMPSLIDEKTSLDISLAFWVDSILISHNVRMDIMNVNASKVKASAMPLMVGDTLLEIEVWLLENRAISPPASSGPMKTLSWAVPCTIELPTISSSLPMILGTMDCEAGRKKPDSVPKIKANTYSSHNEVLPVNIINTSDAVMIKRSASETIMTIRWENRSVMAPPNNMKTARGMP